MEKIYTAVPVNLNLSKSERSDIVKREQYSIFLRRVECLGLKRFGIFYFQLYFLTAERKIRLR